MRRAIGLWALLLAGPAAAQPATVPPVAPPTAAAAAAPTAKSATPARPAKELFGAAKTASPLAPRAIGFYSKGCLAGAKSLAIDGAAWQAMRLSRNRNWGHPELIRYVERLARDAQRLDGWPGLLVGDMSQPRGGPMLTGHASHQIGLDADIWLTPMPGRRLSEKEREELSATSMLGPDELSVDLKVWTGMHVRLVKRAASYPEVERILVHPAIKKALCDGSVIDPDRSWLGKVRPYWGHEYHMHIRMGCPADSANCERQKPTLGDDGCGKEVDDWLKLLSRPPPPKPDIPIPPVKPAKPKPPMTLDQMPPECRAVLGAMAVTPRRLVSKGRAAIAGTAGSKANAVAK